MGVLPHQQQKIFVGAHVFSPQILFMPSSAQAPVQLNWAELDILSLLDRPPTHPG
jgi:hypothetical protein